MCVCVSVCAMHVWMPKEARGVWSVAGIPDSSELPDMGNKSQISWKSADHWATSPAPNLGYRVSHCLT